MWTTASFALPHLPRRSLDISEQLPALHRKAGKTGKGNKISSRFYGSVFPLTYQPRSLSDMKITITKTGNLIIALFPFLIWFLTANSSSRGRKFVWKNYQQRQRPTQNLPSSIHSGDTRSIRKETATPPRIQTRYDLDKGFNPPGRNVDMIHHSMIRTGT